MATIAAAGMCNMTATGAMNFKHRDSYHKSPTCLSMGVMGSSHRFFALVTPAVAHVYRLGADGLWQHSVCGLQGEGSEL